MVMNKTTNENLQCLFSANERVKNGKYRKSAKNNAFNCLSGIQFLSQNNMS